MREKQLPVRDSLATVMTTSTGEDVTVESCSPLSILESILSDKDVVNNLKLPSLKGTLGDGPIMAGLPHQGRLARTDPRFGPTRWSTPEGVLYQILC